MIPRLNFNFRDIVIADPEYTDQRQAKTRPLLIISKSILHQNSGFFVCVGITTNQNKDPFLIPILPKYVEDAMLKEKCQVMCNRIVSLRQDKIKKKIARVTNDFYEIVTQKIKNDVLEL